MREQTAYNAALLSVVHAMVHVLGRKVVIWRRKLFGRKSNNYNKLMRACAKDQPHVERRVCSAAGQRANKPILSFVGFHLTRPCPLRAHSPLLSSLSIQPLWLLLYSPSSALTVL